MNYLQPPPLPTPVVVQNDVGGVVTDYEAQTAVYRMTGWEVGLREVPFGICTLALGLPDVRI